MFQIIVTGFAAFMSLVLCFALFIKQRSLQQKWRLVFGSTGTANLADAQIIREMIRHENELTNHRLTWLLTIEGLLFTALSFAWDKTNTTDLVFVVALLGIFVAGSAAIALDAADAAIHELSGWWELNRPNDYRGPDIMGFRGHYRFAGVIAPWRVVPPLFIMGWFTIFCLKAA